MAWTRSRYRFADPSPDPVPEPLLRSLLRPVEELLASGGDTRLSLSAPARENSYGCTPFPRPNFLDFGSSTASSISVEAYERVKAAQSTLVAQCLSEGAQSASQAAVSSARQSLLALLTINGSGTEVIFAPSGTDAQLHALFFAKSLFREPLTVVVTGSDQTGSGTAQTCKGRHFSQTTARGWEVEKGGIIPGLAEGLESIEIAFAQANGEFRSLGQMDEATLDAVKGAIGGGRSVLLQAMDASKFGWRAPSDACLDAIAERWPGRVQIVMDACQMRLPRARLKTYLAKGYCVLVTGSKFFTGPAFSGALLLPADASRKFAVRRPAKALAGYSSAYDWPEQWTTLRSRLSPVLNLGQWLRWEAALEEMRLYYGVPKSFRDGLTDHFGRALEDLIDSCPNLSLLPKGQNQAQTIFAVTLCDAKGFLPADKVAKIYRALREGTADCSCATAEQDVSARPCQLGQPVRLAGSAALRISLSSRAIRCCWSGVVGETERRVTRLLADLSAAVGKLNDLAGDAAGIGG